MMHCFQLLFSMSACAATRRGVNLAVTSSCLTFTVLQSAHLTLCTTTPEAMAAGLRWYLRPLAVLRAPVDEIVFTLLLSLRFTAIVFEEVRNISLGRAVQVDPAWWQCLKLNKDDSLSNFAFNFDLRCYTWGWRHGGWTGMRWGGGGASVSSARCCHARWTPCSQRRPQWRTQ